MSDGNRRHDAAIRGLGLTAVAAVTAILGGLVWQAGATTSELRERAYPIPATECQKTGDCDERALQIEARQAVTAEAAMDISLGQLVLSIFGFGGLGYTVFYARLAWKEGQRAANLAARSNELTHSTTRAWIEFGFAEISLTDERSDRGFLYVDIKPKETNVGNLPASGVLTAFCGERGTDAMLEFARRGVAEGYKSPGHPGVTIFPGRENVHPGATRIETRVTDPRAGPFDVWVGGYVQYYIDPERKERRTTPFVYIISFSDPDMTGRWSQYYVTPHFYQVAPT